MLLSDSILQLRMVVEGTGLPRGTVRSWGGKSYMKMQDGKWQYSPQAGRQPHAAPAKPKPHAASPKMTNGPLSPIAAKFVDQHKDMAARMRGSMQDAGDKAQHLSDLADAVEKKDWKAAKKSYKRLGQAATFLVPSMTHLAIHEL